MQAIEELNHALSHLVRAKDLQHSPPTTLVGAMVLGSMEFIIRTVRNVQNLLVQEEKRCKP